MASIRKRGDTYTITAYLGYAADGKQIKKTTTFKPPPGVTNGKAERLAREFAVTWEQRIRGFTALDENRTFEELAEWYYANVAPSTLKEHTLIGYKKQVYVHIVPRLGRYKLKDITPSMIDELMRILQESGNTELQFRLKDRALLDGVKREEFSARAGVDRATLYNVLRGGSCRKVNAEKIAAALGKKLETVFDDVTEKRGMTGASANKLKLNLSAIFSAAVKKEVMRRNPCKLATPPKVDTPPASFLDEQQAKALLAAAHGQPDFQLETIVNLFLATGLRAGELTALHWEDLNLQTGLLFVQNTLVRVGGECKRTAPKTATSTRHIILPPYIVQLLQEHQRQQDAKQAQSGGAWRQCPAIFLNQSGGYLLGGNINNKLKRLLKNAGLPENIHLHSLRHTHASLLINSDITAKVIASRLGHGTTKTTLDTYAHVFASSEAKAMQAVQMALFDSEPTQTNL